MKPSSLNNEVLRGFLRLDEPLDEADRETQEIQLTAMREAAVKYAESYTGLPLQAENAECLDNHEDVTLAILALVADMHENRMANLDKQTYTNKTVECILGMHSYNLL